MPPEPTPEPIPGLAVEELAFLQAAFDVARAGDTATMAAHVDGGPRST